MATWVTPRVWVAGERVSAAKMNEISTDLGILFPHTTAGDLAFRSSASSDLTRLANVAGGVLAGGATLPEYVSGSAGQVLISNGTSLPAFSSLVYRRQGGNASNWQNSGTTTYTPTVAYIQAGVRTVSVNTTGSASVTYPVAFAQRPVIYLTPNSGSGTIICQSTGDSITGFTISCRDVVTSGSISVDVNWLAIGVI